MPRLVGWWRALHRPAFWRFQDACAKSRPLLTLCWPWLAGCGEEATWRASRKNRAASGSGNSRAMFPTLRHQLCGDQCSPVGQLSEFHDRPEPQHERIRNRDARRKRGRPGSAPRHGHMATRMQNDLQVGLNHPIGRGRPVIGQVEATRSRGSAFPVPSGSEITIEILGLRRNPPPATPSPMKSSGRDASGPLKVKPPSA